MLKDDQEIYLAPILKRLIEFGYNDEELTNAFGPAGRGLTTISTNWIPKFLGYKSFTKARNDLIKIKLKELIIKGYSLTQLYQTFLVISEFSVKDHKRRNWGGGIEKARTILLKLYFDFFFANMYPDDEIIKLLSFDETVPFIFKQHNKKAAIMNEGDLLTYIVHLNYKTSTSIVRYKAVFKFIDDFI